MTNRNLESTCIYMYLHVIIIINKHYLYNLSQNDTNKYTKNTNHYTYKFMLLYLSDKVNR